MSAPDAAPEPGPRDRPAPPGEPARLDGARLRPLRRADTPAVLRAFAADPAMARQGDVVDLESAQAYVLHVTDRSRGHHAAAIDLDGDAVGLVGLAVDAQNRLAWMFYWLHPDHRGLGLAGAAAATVAHHALSTSEEGPGPGPGPVTGLERLELGHRATNEASGAVARAAGFVREGLQRGKFLIDGERIDVVTYGRLRTDPAPRTPLLPWHDAPSTG